MQEQILFFVIQNQHLQYLDKQGNWRSGKDSQALFRTAHHDEALNTLIEVNAKDIHLRCRILEVELDDKKRPVITVHQEAVMLEQTATEKHTSETTESEITDCR